MAAHDLGYIGTDETVDAARRHADHARGTGALQRPFPELVRHGNTRSAPSALCLDGRQRQSGGRTPRAREGVVAVGANPQTQGRKLAGLIDTAEVLLLTSASDTSSDGTNRQAITAVNRLARDIVTEARAPSCVGTPIRGSICWPAACWKRRTGSTMVARRSAARVTSASGRALWPRRVSAEGAAVSAAGHARRHRSPGVSPGERHALRFPLRPPATHFYHRLPSSGRRRPWRP